MAKGNKKRANQSPTIAEREEAARNLPATDVTVNFPRELIEEYLKNIARDSLPRAQRVIVRPFYLDEDVLRALDSGARAHLGRLGLKNVTTYCEASFTDRTSLTFPSLDACIEEAGASRDPERLAIRWSALSPNGDLSEMEIVGVTEKALEPDRRLGPVPEAASISVTVRSGDRSWIESTFSAVVSLLEANTQVPKQFRPLTIFGRQWFIAVASHTMGALAWAMSYVYLFALTATPDRDAQLAEVLTPSSMDERFERYVRWVFDPELGIAGVFLRLAIPFVLFVGVDFLARNNLARLFPRSSIGIGLARRRRQDTDNLRSLVISGVLLSLVVGVIGNFVYQAISGS